MNNRIGVTLDFKANTQQAVAEMNKLQGLLTNIMNYGGSGSNLGQFRLATEIQKAQIEASKLQTSLQAAFNTSTGKLDLTKFQQSLRMTGTNLQTLKTNLSAMGPEGQMAFSKLAMAIGMAETPMFHLNAKLQTFMKGFASIARYQISTRMFTAIISGFQEAINYSKELNKSLTNIRIVTGYSIEEMEKFTVSANKAAKALSTTTKQYTDASLIYFQQGLSMAEAEKRAAVTIKLAQVTGQSMEDTSNDLTAIWNNFYDGSKSLSYYADVITALGAATASSSKEISTGLEKFMAVGETVGLSYEYATAALATVTATTRQSAEVVGTAFKTLFARLQDLELGETLDDGTTLGKYSEALAAVGVQIQDASGNLRNMDDILDDLASKWTYLGEAEQVALAQTVGGVRQYTQLIALMNNWDFMQSNLDTAVGSEGTLDKQSATYAESWEAASARVTAALESIYEKLFDDQGFIGLTNFAAGFIEVLEDIIDTFGGLKGIIQSVAILLINVYQTQIAAAIDRAQVGITGTISRITQGGIQLKTQAQQNAEMIKAQARETVTAQYGTSPMGQVQSSTMNAILDLQEKYMYNKKNMNAAEQATYESLIKQKEARTEALVLMGEEAKKAQSNADAALKTFASSTHTRKDAGRDQRGRFTSVTTDTSEEVRKLMGEDGSKFANAGRQAAAATSFANRMTEGYTNKITSAAVPGATSEQMKAAGDAARQLNTIFKEMGTTTKEGQAQLEQTYGGVMAEKITAFANKCEEVAQKQERINELMNKQAANTATEDEIFELDMLNGKYDEYNADLERATEAQNRLEAAVQARKDAEAHLKNVTTDPKISSSEEGVIGAANDNVAKAQRAEQAAIKENEVAQGAKAKYDEKGIERYNARLAERNALLKKSDSLTKKEAARLEQLNQMFKSQPKAIKEATSAQGDMSGAAAASAAQFEALKSKLKTMLSPEDQGKIDQYTQRLMEAGISADTATRENAEFRAQLDALGVTIDKLNIKPVTFGQRLTAAASLMSGIGMAITSFTSAFNTLTSVDSTPLEKVTAILTTLGMVIPMLTTALNANNIAKLFGLNLQRQENGVLAAGVSGKAAMWFATKVLKAEQVSATAVQWANNAAMYASPIFWIPAILIILIGLLTVIIGLIVSINSGMSESEKAAESIQATEEIVASLNEELEKTKTALQEVKDLLAEYEEVENAFDNLIVGSEKWNENLQKHQEILKQLIDQYPELLSAGIIGFNDQGILTVLDPDAMTQFVQGSATAEMLKTTVAQAAAENRLRVQKAEEADLQKGRDLQKDAEKVLETASTNWEKNWQSFIDNYLVGRSQFQSDEDIASTLATTLSDENNTYIQNMPVEEFINYLSQNGKLQSGDALLESSDNAYAPSGQKTFTEEYMNLWGQYGVEFLSTAIREKIEGANLYVDGESFLKAYDDLNKDHQQHMAQINQQNELAWQTTAQTVLSNLKGYASMSEAQRQAATMLLGEQYSRLYNETLIDDVTVGAQRIDGKLIWGSDETGGDTLNNQLLTVLGKTEEDYAYGQLFDAGGNVSANFEYNELGRDLLKKYIAETYDIAEDAIGGSFYSKWEEDQVTVNNDKIKEIKFSDVLTWASTKYAQNQSDPEGLLNAVQGFEESVAAGFSLNFNNLTNAEMEKVRVKDGDTWKLTDEYRKTMTDTIAGVLGYGLDEDARTEEHNEEINSRLESITEAAIAYNAELAKTIALQQDVQTGNALIAQESEKYDFDTETLERYAKSLQNAKTISYEAAAKMAVANAKMSKGINQLRDDLEDNIDVLRKFNIDSYEFAEAATTIAESLELIFGVEISNEKIKEWANEDTGYLEKLAAGGQEALDVYELLRLEAAKDYVLSLSIDDEYKTQFQQLLDDLDGIEDKTIGATLDINNEEALNNLDTLLRQGKISVDQMNQMFGAIGWAPDIEYVTDLNKTRTITASYDFETRGEAEKADLDKIGGIKYTAIDTYAQVSIPTIKGESGNKKPTFTYTGTSGAASITTPKTGSGSSSKKTKKKAKDELKPYRQINAVLDNLQRKYDQVSEAKDRAFGPDRLKYIEQEIELTKKLAEAEKIKYEESKQHANDAAATLQQYDVTFDENGLINNYNEAHQKQLDIYNKAVDDFNKGRISESKFETIENAYEHFTEYLDKYEEFYGDMRDQQERFIELENQRIDLQLEKVSYNVEFKISIQDDALTLLDYYFENIEDNAYKAAEAIALLGQKTDVLVKKNEAYTQGIYDTLEAAGFTAEEAQTWLETGAVPEGKQLTEETIEQLRGYRDELISGMQDARDNAIQAEELIGSSFEHWNSEMDRSAEKLERVNSTLQTYKDIVDLVGAENLGLSTEMVVETNEAMVAGSIARAKQAKAELDANEAAVKKQRQHYETLKANLGEDDPVTRAAFETLRNMEDQVASSEEELLSAWQDGLQAAVDALSANVDAVIADFEKAMTGIYGSFDALQTAYDQYSQTNERYVADYAKIYELSKLNRDIMKSIDETDNVAAKRELLELQEEINEKQESGVEMSQYELDELRARYDLKLAEMALEDAQNAKSQVRMRRDAEGNWGYVYTADQNAIDSALQNYEDKMYAYQQLTQDYAKEIESQLIGLPQEFAEAMRTIATDVTLTEEERKIRMEETTEFYRSQYKYLLEELEKTNDNSERLYDEDQQAYLKATGQKIIANKDWLDTFNAFTDTDGAYDKFFQATETVVDKIDEEWKKYDTNIQSVFTAVGEDIDNFLTSDKLKEFQDKQQELVDKGTELGTAYTNGFSAVMTAAQTAAEEYQSTIQPMITANEKLIGQINDAIAAYEALLKAAGIEIPDPNKGTSDKADTGNSNGSGNNTVIKNWDNGQWDKETVKNAQEFMGMTNANGYWGSNSQAWAEKRNYANLDEVVAAMDLAKKQQTVQTDGTLYLHITPNSSGQVKTSVKTGQKIQLKYNDKYAFNPFPYEVWLDNRLVGFTDKGYKNATINKRLGVAFDTGGYTGSWGSEGRMAMLHQKEIVLNASDTENFLSAIGIVRDIAKAIDLTALSQSTMRANLSAAVGNIGSQVLEQEVTIHAEFPNATNHSEIEEAFNTLLNRASQFANRKNK